MNYPSAITSVATPARTSQRYPMIYWKVYVSAFYAIWIWVAFGLHHFREILEHWRMTLVMIPGSLVAGSTPMAGGTVAFPILVLAFHQPSTNARNFGFMIQAMGMTSAVLFALGRKVRLPLRLVMGSTAGSAVGLLVGTFLIAPHVREGMVKLLFACLWMSFGVLILIGYKEICGLKSTGPPNTAKPERIGLLVGLIGGLTASMIGVGVELCIFAMMVLVFRADLRIAIPSAICAGALASAVGVTLHVVLGDMGRSATMDFFAAMPLAIFGAPIGAWLSSILPRSRVLYFVAGLCVLQFFWSLQQNARGGAAWIFTAVALSLALLLLFTLYRAGKRREAYAR